MGSGALGLVWPIAIVYCEYHIIYIGILPLLKATIKVYQLLHLHIFIPIETNNWLEYKVKRTKEKL
jgi:hypothetical protein